MIASDEGHFDVVKTLIEAGANVNDTDEVCKYVYMYMHCCCKKCTCTLYTCIKGL